MTALLSTMAEVTIGPGYSIVFEALDPSSLAAVAGVVVTTATLYCDAPDLVPEGAGLSEDVPLYTPVELNDQGVDAEPSP